MKKDISDVLFPVLGQYFTMDGFVKQIMKDINGVKCYETGVARPLSGKEKKEVVKEVIKRLRKYE